LESLTLLRFGATHLSSFRLSYLKRARLHYVPDRDVLFEERKKRDRARARLRGKCELKPVPYLSLIP
jgi:hypothetical protein